MNNDLTIARAPVPGCPACEAKRRHTTEDWKLHTYAGHGYLKGHGWSHPDLDDSKVKKAVGGAV